MGFDFRSGPRQPIGRRVYKRTSASEPHPSEDRGDGGGRRTTVRHLPTAQGVPRMREQNPEPLSGDRKHPTRSDRRFETETGDARSRDQDRALQKGESFDLQLGN